MASVVVKGIVVPVIAELTKELGVAFIDALSSASIAISQPYSGAVWISVLDGTWGTWNGQVVSCYFHPSQKHTATTNGRNGEKRSVAEAGHWAISIQSRGLSGNKTFYNNI